MSRNPKFDAMLAKMKKIHDSKNEDYAEEGDPFSNFVGAARVAGLDVEDIFLALIGVKLERLRQLRSGKTPNYESKHDTKVDLAVYATLMAAFDWDPPKEPGPPPPKFEPKQLSLGIIRDH